MAKNINVILSLQDRFTSKMTVAQASALKFKTNLATAQVVSDKFGTAMKKMEQIAIASTAVVGSAAVAMSKTSLDAYEEFNGAMNEVAGIKNLKATSQEMKYLTGKAKEASKAVVGSTYKDAADSLKYMALAGWDTTQSINALVPVLKAIRINGGDVQATADAITDSMTALGLSSNQTADYIDMCTAVQSAANTNMLQLNNTLIKCGAGMKSLKIPLKDTMSLIGILSSGGFKDTEAGTILNSLYSRLVKDSAEAQAGLDQLGLSVYDNNGHLKSALTLFQELSKKAKGLTEQERNSIFSKIGGRFRSQLEQIIAGFTEIGEDGQTAYEKIQKAIENCEGASDRFMDALGSEWAGAVKNFNSSWKNFTADVGEIIAPYATDSLNYLTNKLPTIENWLKEKLPPALDKGKEIVIEIKNALENMKHTLEWIGEHWKSIAVTAGVAYSAMGAFRLGTDVVTGLNEAEKFLKGRKNVKKNLKNSAEYISAKSNIVPLSNTKYDKNNKLNNTPFWSSSVGISSNILGSAKSETEGLVGIPTDLGNLDLTEAVFKPAYSNETVEGKGFKNWLNKNISKKGKNGSDILSSVGGGVAAEMLGTVGAGGSEVITTGALMAGGGTGTGAVAGSVGGAIAGAGIAGTAGIIALIAGTLIMVWKNSDLFRNSIAKLGERAEPMLKHIKNGFDSIKEALAPVWEATKSFFGAIGDVLGLVIKFLSPVLGVIMDIVGIGFDVTLQAIGISLKGIAGAAKWVSDGISGVCDWLDKVIERLDWITEKWNAVKGYFETNINEGAANAGQILNDPATSYVEDQNKGKKHTFGEMFGVGMASASISENALGTNYWKGGITSTNERGGEIMDLPKGTRIIPADKSEKMVKNKGSIILNVYVDKFYGDDESYLNRVCDTLAGKLAKVI